MSGVKEEGYTREEGLTAVGAGWSPLINHLFDLISPGGHYASLGVVVEQVKEKFGGLRFYYRHNNTDIELTAAFRAEVHTVEMESFTLCEVCGQPGQPMVDSWVRTLCPEHAKPDSQPFEPRFW